MELTHFRDACGVMKEVSRLLIIKQVMFLGYIQRPPNCVKTSHILIKWSITFFHDQPG